MKIDSNTDLRDAFFSGVKEVMQNDINAVILTADHGAFLLSEIEKEFPERYFNVGISEQNMINIASGMAMKGKSVYAYSINNFLIFRALEQININICAMNLNVNLIGTGAGFTYSTDGFTHHGVQDLGIAMSLPNLSVFNVTDSINSYYLAKHTSLKSGPKYFRIEKGTVPELYDQTYDLEKGMGLFNDNTKNEMLLISTGYISHMVKEIADNLSNNLNKVSFLDIFKMKPFDESLFVKLIENKKKIVMVEENFYSSSIGNKISSVISRYSKNIDFLSRIIGETKADKMILKPLDGYGGSGVIVIEKSAMHNIRSLLDFYINRDNYVSNYVILQDYIEGADQGDVRVLMLNGKPIGALRRRPMKGDVCSNISVGGRAEKYKLNKVDKLLCEKVGEKLVRDGIYFAGLDIINGKLIEVNVMSPGTITEINRLNRVRLQEKIVDYLEQVVEVDGVIKNTCNTNMKIPYEEASR